MKEDDTEYLETQLSQHLEFLPQHPVHDINAALQVADILEARGYAFTLIDLCARSLYDEKWRAVFNLDGVSYEAENCDAPVAICEAAVAALEQ